MIEYAQFESIIRTLQSREKMAGALNNVFREYNYQTDFMNGYGFVDDKLNNIIVDLLGQMFCDEDDWISYWLYELDCGEKWQPGIIKDRDGNDIKLETIEDLWNLLMTNIVDGESCVYF